MAKWPVQIILNKQQVKTILFALTNTIVSDGDLSYDERERLIELEDFFVQELFPRVSEEEKPQ